MMLKKSNKTVRRSGRGSIALIAILLMASAILRVASGADEAFAQGAGKPDARAQPEDHAVSTSQSHGMQMGGSSKEEMSNLLVALQARETKLKEREMQMEIRHKALAVVDEEIEKRLILLENTENELRATLALADSAAEDDLARLTSVYENMKPKDAAALFEEMEPGFAAGFLGRMRPDAAASVLAGLSPAAAYSISVILAGRNANAPKS